MSIRANSLVGLAGSAIVAAMFAMGACTSSKENTTPSEEGGTTSAGEQGGAPASGGASASPGATGGNTSTSAAPATGGSTSAGTGTPFTCKMTAATTGVLSPGTSGTWGDKIGIIGGKFGYQSTDADKLTVDTAATAGVINLMGTITVGSYSGAGLYTNDCADISAYPTGMKVELWGDLGGAKVNVQLQTNADYPIDAPNKKGACLGAWSDGSCASNKTEYLTIPAAKGEALALPWTSFTGGAPNALDLKDMVGVQFHVDCPSDATAACAVNLNIGSITVY